jgi:hypothetical protein
LHPDSLTIMGESMLYGLEKPDKSTRPIGVGGALRRLAGRCVYAQLKDAFGTTLTATPVAPEQLQAAGFAVDRVCNKPLQLGCGVAGGAEIAIAAVRLLLEERGDWAVLSDDKRNGYNALWREAIFRGVRRFYPCRRSSASDDALRVGPQPPRRVGVLGRRRARAVTRIGRDRTSRCGVARSACR